MQVAVSHVILFAYFLQIAFGIAGLAAMAALHYRLRSTVTGALLFVMTCLLAVLLINLVSYYLVSILRIALGPNALRYGVVLALSVLVRLGVMRALLALPRVPRRTTVAVTAAIIVYQAGYTVAAMMLPPSDMDALYLPGIAVGSAYLLFVGIVMVRGARAEDEGTVRSLVHRLGVFTIVFAPLSTLAYVLKQLFPEAAALQVSYDFLFFVVWSAITVGVFLRYLSRPTALLEQGHVSEGFVKRYGITPREAEVVKLISFGLSNQEIADRMCVSFTTARTHIYNIFRKTDAKTRVELLRIVTGFRE